MNYSIRTKWNLIFSLIALLTVFFGLQSAIVNAQDAGFEAGLAGQAANMNSNAIGTYTLANSILANKGRAKIKAGRATTTFIHSSNIYLYMLGYITFDETEPKTESGRMQRLQGLVTKFESRMIKAGNYKIHDRADSASFASVLSYQAQYDREPLTPAQLAIFQQTRQNTIRYLLNSPDYQGLPEQEKEKMYIMDAIMSEQAIEAREKARVARTKSERESADQEAKKYAEYKMHLYTEQTLRELLQAGKQLK